MLINFAADKLLKPRKVFIVNRILMTVNKYFQEKTTEIPKSLKLSNRSPSHHISEIQQAVDWLENGSSKDSDDCQMNFFAEGTASINHSRFRLTKTILLSDTRNGPTNRNKNRIHAHRQRSALRLRLIRYESRLRFNA